MCSSDLAVRDRAERTPLPRGLPARRRRSLRPRGDAGPDRLVGAGAARLQLESLSLRNLRGYAELDAAFGSGPHLVHGPNAAGKTSLLEAVVLLSWGHSHRTTTDAELIRWGADFTRVEGRIRRASADATAVEVTLARAGPSSSRKRILVNGVGRRTHALAGLLRVVLFAPEEMLLVVGAPGLRRTLLDRLAGQRFPTYLHDLSEYTRTLHHRNSLLRAIREETATRAELRFWDTSFLQTATSLVEARLRLLDELATPLARAHAEIAPEEATAGESGTLRLAYVTNAPAADDESVGDALARRLHETAEKEVWNGSTLIGPHRDDLQIGRAHV